jgi:hypothetical protein
MFTRFAPVTWLVSFSSRSFSPSKNSRHSTLRFLPESRKAFFPSSHVFEPYASH